MGTISWVVGIDQLYRVASGPSPAGNDAGKHISMMVAKCHLAPLDAIKTSGVRRNFHGISQQEEVPLGDGVAPFAKTSGNMLDALH